MTVLGDEAKYRWLEVVRVRRGGRLALTQCGRCPCEERRWGRGHTRGTASGDTGGRPRPARRREGPRGKPAPPAPWLGLPASGARERGSLCWSRPALRHRDPGPRPASTDSLRRRHTPWRRPVASRRWWQVSCSQQGQSELGKPRPAGNCQKREDASRDCVLIRGRRQGRPGLSGRVRSSPLRLSEGALRRWLLTAPSPPGPRPRPDPGCGGSGRGAPAQLLLCPVPMTWPLGRSRWPRCSQRTSGFVWVNWRPGTPLPPEGGRRVGAPGPVVRLPRARHGAAPRLVLRLFEPGRRPADSARHLCVSPRSQPQGQERGAVVGGGRVKSPAETLLARPAVTGQLAPGCVGGGAHSPGACASGQKLTDRREQLPITPITRE